MLTDLTQVIWALHEKKEKEKVPLTCRHLHHHRPCWEIRNRCWGRMFLLHVYVMTCKVHHHHARMLFVYRYHGGHPLCCFTRSEKGFGSLVSKPHLPIQDQYLFGQPFPLHLPGSHCNIIEETETHMFVGLCMMARRTYDSKGVTHFILADWSACLNHTSSRKTSTMGSFTADVEG